jgi:hypothetical protein
LIITLISSILYLLQYMATLTVYDMMKLREEIPMESLNWRMIHINPSIGAVSLLFQHPENILWDRLSARTDAIPMFEQHLDKIHWNLVSKNKEACSFLKKHVDRIDGNEICQILQYKKDVIPEFLQKDYIALLESYLEFNNLLRNPFVRHAIKKKNIITDLDPDGILATYRGEENITLVTYLNYACDWTVLSANPHAIPLLKKYIYMMRWDYLGSNPNAHLIYKMFPVIPTFNKDILDLDNMTFCGYYGAPFIKRHMDQMDEFHWESVARWNRDMDFLEEHLDFLDWQDLSINEYALPLFEKYPEDVNWNMISKNPGAIPFIEKHLAKVGTTDSKVNWNLLSCNENALPILERNIDKIHWDLFSKHPDFHSFLIKYPHVIEEYQIHEYVDWSELSTRSDAIPLLEQYLNHVDWFEVSTLECMLPFLLKHPEHIDWSGLSVNEDAIALLEENLDKIDWENVSHNKNAWPILSKNLDKVNWIELSQNPAIFTYDYDKIKERCSLFKEELMEVRFHPRHYEHFASWGFEEFVDS